MRDWLQGILSCATLAAAMMAAAGCEGIFVPKYRVIVDAICAPGQGMKSSGVSYRLMAKKSVVSSAGSQAQVPVVKACVDAALMGKGMFEAPANAAPEIFIEVGFGVDATPRVEASARETFLQLSARSNPGRSLDRATGPEVWDVRVAVLGATGRMETAMPLLASVAAEYLGTDTKQEARIEVPQNSPMVRAVREGAVQALDGQGGGGASGAAASIKPVTTK